MFCIDLKGNGIVDVIIDMNQPVSESGHRLEGGQRLLGDDFILMEDIKTFGIGFGFSQIQTGHEMFTDVNHLLNGQFDISSSTNRLTTMVFFSKFFQGFNPGRRQFPNILLHLPDFSLTSFYQS